MSDIQESKPSVAMEPSVESEEKTDKGVVITEEQFEQGKKIVNTVQGMLTDRKFTKREVETVTQIEREVGSVFSFGKALAKKFLGMDE